MRYLKTNTATVITVGPFLDVTDGITPETALTVTGCHLTLMVDNAGTPTLALDADATASSGNNDMVHITNDDAGMYSLELTAANLNYLGGAILAIIDTDVHLPVFHEFTILPALVYDSLIAGSDNLQVDTIQVGGTTQTARDIGASVLLSSGTGTGQVSLSSGTVTAGVISNGAITAAAIADGAIDAATFAADVDAEVAAYVWNAATASYGTAGTYGALVESGNVGGGAIVAASVTGNVGGNVTGSVGSVTGAVGSVTGNVGGNVTGSVGSVTGAVGSVTGNVGGNVTGSVGSVASGGITAASIATDAIDDDAIAADVTAVIAAAVWNALTASYGTANTYGALIESGNVGGGNIVAASVTGAVGSVTGAVGSVTGAVGSVTGAVGSVTGNVGGNVTGSVGSVTGAVGSVTGNVGGNVTGSVGSVAAGGITAASIATDAIDADALASDFVDEILDEQIGDSTVTLRQAIRIMLAVLAGKATGGGTNTITFRNVADDTNRVVATVDADGNRSAVTLG